jgi:membrane-bound ClpP family serine protease
MLWLVIVLIAVGILLLLLEVLVIPGTGFAGIAGFASIVAGVWVAYARLGTSTGNTVLLITIAVNVIAIWLGIRSKTWKKAALVSTIDGKVNTVDHIHLKVGDVGKTISRCVPIGKAEFNGNFVEVDARGDFIDPNTKIEIIKIDNNKIYIKTLKK